MEQQNFTTTILVDQSAAAAFKSINNVRGWWSETVEGATEKLNDEFIYRHPPYHYSKQLLVEVVPDKKVVWLITDSELSFTKDKSEWNGTKVIFEISTEGGKTKIDFTHEGLVPQIECYKDCSGGWNHYLHGSLVPLITTGIGNPDKKKEVTA